MKTMKKILTFLLIILSVLFLKFTFDFTVNEFVVKNYENGDYSENLINFLFPLNFEESYLVFYNDGNLKYKNGDFSGAREKYEESLRKGPPSSKVCDVRINLALSMVKLVKSSDTNAESSLEAAKNVLYGDGCANKADDNGKSETAEKLEQEITELQESLDNNSSDSNSSSNDDEENQDQEENPPENIEEQLQQLEQQGHSEHETDMELYEDDGSSYYSGANW